MINKYNVVVIDVDDEVDTLVDTYVKEGIIPLKYRDDAVHIATASIYDLNLIVSWNFKHIVMIKIIGLSAKFITLNDAMQDALIERVKSGI